MLKKILVCYGGLRSPKPYITSHVFKTIKMPTIAKWKIPKYTRWFIRCRESADHGRNFSKPQFQRRFSVSFTFVLSVRQYWRGRNHFAGDIRSSVTPSDPDSLTLLTYFPFPAFVSFGVNELRRPSHWPCPLSFFKLTYTNIFKMTLTFKGASRYSSCVTIFSFFE